MGMSTGGSGGALSEINVTPLVDVMLVLVIIFMITAPMMNVGVSVDLPKTEPVTLDLELDDPLILTIDRQLNYKIRDNPVPRDQLEIKLAAIAAANPDKPLFLQADGEVPYREVATALAAAKHAGMPRVGMVFEPKTEEE